MNKTLSGTINFEKCSSFKILEEKNTFKNLHFAGRAQLLFKIEFHSKNGF